MSMRPRSRIALWRTVTISTILLLLGIINGLPILIVPGLLGLAGCVAARYWRGGGGIQARRWQRRSGKHDGLASWYQLIRNSTANAMRGNTSILAPSTRNLTADQRKNIPINTVAAPIARMGRRGPRIYASIEEIVLRVTAPRGGKSGSLSCRIADAPGAVIATSTRTDLFELTAARRSVLGPVRIFNPGGMGGLPTTVRFNPLTGCRSPVVAYHRAQDLIIGAERPGQHGANGDRLFWTEQATIALMYFLHAAALADLTMYDVNRWVSMPTQAGQVVQILLDSPDRSMSENARQFLETNPNTRTSATATIRPALIWLTNPTAAAAAGQRDDLPVTAVDEEGVTTPEIVELDVRQLITSRTTCYVLGAYDTNTAPLVTAFVGEMVRTARALAALMPGDRLDPALLIALDEAAIICPVPLPDWTADMGGRNISLDICVQSRAQLIQRWGPAGASIILNNAANILLGGGLRDNDDLTAWTDLIGQRTDDVPHFDAAGHIAGYHRHQVPIISAAQLSQLPFGKAVLIRRQQRPAIVDLEMAWDRADIIAARRRATARSTLAAPPTATEWTTDVHYGNPTAAQTTADSSAPDLTAAQNAAGPHPPEGPGLAPGSSASRDRLRDRFRQRTRQAARKPSSSEPLSTEPPPEC